MIDMIKYYLLVQSAIILYGSKKIAYPLVQLPGHEHRLLLEGKLSWILVIHNSSRATHDCVYHLLLIQGPPLRLVRQGPEQGMGALTGCECDSHCESESPHPGMWEGELGSKGIPLM